MNNWEYLGINIFASQKKEADQLLTRYARVGIDVTDGVKVTHRIWVMSDNPDAYGGDGLKHTPVGLTYELRNEEDLFALVRQFAELLKYLKDKTSLVKDDRIKVTIQDRHITIDLLADELEVDAKKEEALELEDKDDVLELDNEIDNEVEGIYEEGDGGDIMPDDLDDLTLEELDD